MKYILDTHALIWFLSGDPQLSTRARYLMDDSANELLISVASLWEMAVKVSIGKLNLNQPFEKLFPEQLENNSIEILGITIDHLNAACNLPFHHRDPFDRLIIAQAEIEQMSFIGADTIFDRYGVQRHW